MRLFSLLLFIFIGLLAFVLYTFSVDLRDPETTLAACKFKYELKRGSTDHVNDVMFCMWINGYSFAPRWRTYDGETLINSECWQASAPGSSDPFPDVAFYRVPSCYKKFYLIEKLENFRK